MYKCEHYTISLLQVTARCHSQNCSLIALHTLTTYLIKTQELISIRESKDNKIECPSHINQRLIIKGMTFCLEKIEIEN